MLFKTQVSKMLVLALAAFMVLSLPMGAIAATANGFTSPQDGATVSGTVEVKGYASDPNFMKWQLDLLPGGDSDAAIFLALGEEAGEFTFSLDTVGLPNGEHAFRLRVVRTDSNYDEFVSKFTIANGDSECAERDDPRWDRLRRTTSWRPRSAQASSRLSWRLCRLPAWLRRCRAPDRSPSSLRPMRPLPSCLWAPWKPF